MSKVVILKLSKAESERLLEDCLDLMDGYEVYIGYSGCEYDRRLYKSIRKKLIKAYYGVDLDEEKDKK